MRFGGRQADIRVRAQSERLRPAKTKWNLRIQDQGMVLKESSETVFLGQPIVIVLSAQKQIVPLRHEVSKAHFNIKAPEIKVVEPIVIKQLLPHIDQSVEGFRNPRLVKGSSSWRQNKIALLST